MDIVLQKSGAPAGDGVMPGRLSIEYVELENFKSYGGKKIIGPFHESFSAIIGPNGSGKSNVIDALLFVFGKKAKKIRLNKVSELIHNSALVPSPAFARVTVHFVNVLDLEDGSTETVPNSKITLAREATRENQSKYILNGKGSTFGEVSKFLSSRGIDLEHNRFLILQGEVEQIAMMKPKAPSAHEDGFLEYLEDIIGTSSFREPIKEADERVSKAWLVRSDAMMSYKRACDHVDEIEGKRREAAEFFAVRRKEIDLKCGLLQIQCLLDEDKVKRSKADVVDAEKKVEAISSDREKLDELTKMLNKAKDAALAKARQAEEADGLQEAALREVEKKFDEAREEVKAHKEKISKLTKAAEASKTERADLEKKVERWESELESLKKKLPSAEASMRTKRDELEALLLTLRVQEQPLNEEVKKAREALLLAGEAARGIESEIQAARKRMAKFTSEIEQMTATEAANTEEFANLQSNKQKMENDLIKWKNDFDHATTSLAKAETRLSQARTAAKKAESAQTSASAELANAAQTKDSIEREYRAANSSASDPNTKFNYVCQVALKVQNALLKADSRYKNKIFGTLPSLMTDEDKTEFWPAVSCADLSTLVVEDVDTAQAAIKIATDQRLGQVRVTVLENIHGVHTKEGMLNAISALPSQHKRLIDHLKLVGEKFRPVFHMTLRNRFLVEDMETACDVSAQARKRGVRIHVVTRDGDEIEATGVMTGGGGNRKPNGGGNNPAAQKAAPRKVTEEEVNKHASRVENLTAEVQKLTKTTDEANEAVQAAAAEVMRLKAEVRTLEGKISSAEDSLSSYKIRVDGLAAFMAGKKDRETDRAAKKATIATLAKEIDTNTTNLVIAKEPELAAQEQVDILELRLRELGGAGRSAKEREAKTAASEHQNIKKKTSELEKDLSKAAQTLRSETELRTQSEAEIVKVRSLIAAQEELLNSLELEAVDMIKLREDASNLFEEARKDLEKAKIEMEKGQRELKEFAEEDARRQEALEDRKAEHEVARAQLSKRQRNLIRLREEFFQLPEEDLEDDTDLVETTDTEEGGEKPAEGAITADTIVANDVEMANNATSSSAEGGAKGRNTTKKRASNNRKSGEGNNAASESISASGVPIKSMLLKGSETPVEKRRYNRLVTLFRYVFINLPREEVRALKESELTLQIETIAMMHATGQGGGKVDVDEGWRILTDFKERARERKAKEIGFNESEELYTKDKTLLQELKSHRLGLFTVGFETIAVKVREMYQMLTLGGDAELELIDRADPFESGVAFSVRPPRKSWKRIDNLSGGEKTLSSLAFIFALHHYRPTPLYFLDEIDAALDFRNVSIIGNYIKSRARGAQFITISLRHQMFELADRLVGIYKTFDVTKTVSITPGSIVPNQTPARIRIAGDDEEQAALRGRVPIAPPSILDGLLPLADARMEDEDEEDSAVKFLTSKGNSRVMQPALTPAERAIKKAKVIEARHALSFRAAGKDNEGAIVNEAGEVGAQKKTGGGRGAPKRAKGGKLRADDSDDDDDEAAPEVESDDE